MRMPIGRLLIACLLGGCTAWLCIQPVDAAAAQESGYLSRPEVRAFIAEMAQEHGFESTQLERLFAAARHQPAILRAMILPPESTQRSWQAYRAMFVNGERIDAGLRFLQSNREAIERAETAYGVPREILVAIIGVETQYGRNVGGYRVIDALATLAFDFPQRAEFFRRELEQYLLFTREEHVEPLQLRGSYAGAIGMAQFMPGSYRRFAVDFDGDGRRDLYRSASDAVGSVGNFLQQHGWQAGAPVAVRARAKGVIAQDAWRPLLRAGVKPSQPVGGLESLGFTLAQALAPETLCSLVELPSPGQEPEFWAGLENFYVLTRYNRSSFYAIAVLELAQAIDAASRVSR